jgi:hypothetical protein
LSDDDDVSELFVDSVFQGSIVMTVNDWILGVYSSFIL